MTIHKCVGPVIAYERAIAWYAAAPEEYNRKPLIKRDGSLHLVRLLNALGQFLGANFYEPCCFAPDLTARTIHITTRGFDVPDETAEHFTLIPGGQVEADLMTLLVQYGIVNIKLKADAIHPDNTPWKLQ